MTVFTTEDANQCTLGGGSVVSTEGGGGCGASSVSAFSPGADGGASRPESADVALTAFRGLRARSAAAPIVQAALALNAIAAPEIERLAETDEALKVELVRGLETVGRLADAVVNRRRGGEIYDARTHAHLADLGRRLSERTDEAKLRQGIAFLLSLAEPLVGRSLAEIGVEILGRAKRKPVEPSPDTKTVVTRLPSAAIVAAADRRAFSNAHLDLSSTDRFGSIIDILIKEAEAAEAIANKAKALGGWIGGAIGDIEAVTGGYRQRYANADIYVGSDGRAFEVHGDIRAKYNYFHGPAGPLGLPVTDETGTPDGVGRYNHFEHGGSIYWTPDTGPMMVRGVIRNLWASQGWERGALGYPVADEYRLPGLYPQDNPNLAWSAFQNGTLFAQGNAVAPALAAEISPAALKSLIRTFFDRKLHDAGQDLGLEAQVDLVAVSGWEYGFFASTPRTITYKLYGFHSNPIIADTTFDITIRLRFSTAWPMSFTYPTTMSLIVALDWLSVHASGVGSGQLANGVFDGIEQAFNRGGPDPAHPETPNGAIFITSFPTDVNQSGDGALDVINTLTTAQGGLQILVNPLPPSFGGFRRLVAQNRIDGFLDSF